MLRKNNRIKAIILCCLLCSTALATMPCNAAEQSMIAPPNSVEDSYSIISPCWSNVRSLNIKIEKDTNNNVVVYVTITGESGTTYRSGRITLEKVTSSETVPINSWGGLSSSSSMFNFKKTSAQKASGTFKVSVSIVATKNGKSEVITGSQTVTF